MDNFDRAVECAREFKRHAVDVFDEGDMPHVIFVEEADKPSMVIIAPLVDRNAVIYALHAAGTLVQPSALTVVADAHSLMKKAEPGQTVQEAFAEFAETYKHGDLQKACEAGACDRGEIVDVLSCVRLGRDGKFIAQTVPYRYHGKTGGVPFEWLAEHPHAITGRTEMPADKVRGVLPDALHAAMHATKLHLPNIDALCDAVKMPPEQRQWHAGNALIRVLKDEDFNIFDLRQVPDGVEQFADLLALSTQK